MIYQARAPYSNFRHLGELRLKGHRRSYTHGVGRLWSNVGASVRYDARLRGCAYGTLVYR